MTDLTPTKPKLDGTGHGNHLPRVTVTMTTRQLERLIEALDCADPGRDGLGGYDPQQCDEWAALHTALEGVRDGVAQGLKAPADISLAPEVHYG